MLLYTSIAVFLSPPKNAEITSTTAYVDKKMQDCACATVEKIRDREETGDPLCIIQ